MIHFGIKSDFEEVIRDFVTAASNLPISQDTIMQTAATLVLANQVRELMDMVRQLEISMRQG